MEIVKGKRTKRPRPHSPSSACLSDERSMSSEEDEDMANCLILLAQGFDRHRKKNINLERKKHQEEEQEEEHSKREKLLDSIATETNDTYVYECKTCNRTFTSFQALGGHRASHKKPKTNPKEDRHVKREQIKGQISDSPPPTPVVHVATIKPVLATKVHECSICGSEFSSGQALGGHMRRHRVAPPQEKPPSESEDKSDDHKTVNILSFDLNLPAPMENDQNQVVEPTFEFRPKSHLVFLGPALVGCHY